MAMIFDQMSSEYGWTDQQVLDLPLCRVSDIAETIGYRRKMEMTANASLVEWSTKTISLFIAATVPTPKGKKNPLLQGASEISLNLTGKAPEKQLPASSSLHELSPEQIEAIINRPSAAQEAQSGQEMSEAEKSKSAEAFQLQFARFMEPGR